jgi:hypothetical protein
MKNICLYDTGQSKVVKLAGGQMDGCIEGWMDGWRKCRPNLRDYLALAQNFSNLQHYNAIGLLQYTFVWSGSLI